MLVSITDKSFLLKFILSDINISMQTILKMFSGMFFDLQFYCYIPFEIKDK